MVTCLAACGGSAATVTIDVAPTQTRAAEVAQLATLAVPTTTPSPTATIAPTATPAPTATLAPTMTPSATATPRGAPTSTLAPAPPTATPLPSDVPPGGYLADFSIWPAGEQADQLRASLDPATGEYRLTVLRSGSIQSVYAPEGQAFGDFTLEFEVRRTAGPDTGAYGVAFRVQPREPDARTSVRYVFFITPQGFFSLELVNKEGSGQRIQPLVFSRAIKRGDAPNRLLVSCQGDRITLGANGQELGTYSAALVDPGYLGIFVRTPREASEMEAAFSNLRLFPPGSTPQLDRLVRRSPGDP